MDTYRSDPSAGSARRARDQAGSRLGWAVAIVVALVAAVVIIFFNSDPPQRVAIADIEDPASPMIGEAVTIEGEVVDNLSEQAMTVDDGESDEPLLVIVHANTVIDGVAPAVAVDPLANEVDPLSGAEQVDPVAAPDLVAPVVPSDGPVRVTGTVDTFDPAAVTEVLAITLDGEAFEPFEGDAYLLADQVETSFDPSTIPPQASPSGS